MQPTTETVIIDGEQKEIVRCTVTLDNGDEVLAVGDPLAAARFLVGLAALPVVEPPAPAVGQGEDTGHAQGPAANPGAASS